MIFAAYLPLTLCDYPGKVAAMVFTQGCNFNCPWCHNAHLIPANGSSPALDVEAILTTVIARHTHGTIEALVFSGGEPTIHADLPDVLERCKAAGLAVKLDTNGAQPARLQTCLDRRLVDFVAMDIKAPWRKYSVLTGVPADTDALRESVHHIAGSGVAHQFRTTRATPWLSDDDCAAIADQIPPGSPHVWQPFRPVNERTSSWL